jgi:hypothetical protein
MAGSWYWTMSRFNDAVNSSAEDFPVWNAGSLQRYADSYEELSAYLSAAGTVADRSGLAAPSSTARSDWGAQQNRPGFAQ